MKEIQDAKQEIGLGENKGAQEQRTRLMAERANLGDEAARQQKMRMAEFFASWGTTPGNTLVAGMHALKKTIPDLISDDREQAKARKEADKALYDLDQAVRAEKLGDFDKAAAFKEKAADRANQLNMKLIDYQGDMAKAGASLEAARIRERGDTERHKQRVAHETERDRLSGEQLKVAQARQKVLEDREEARQKEVAAAAKADASRVAGDQYIRAGGDLKAENSRWAGITKSQEWATLNNWADMALPKGSTPEMEAKIRNAKIQRDQLLNEHKTNIGEARRQRSIYGERAGFKDEDNTGTSGTDIGGGFSVRPR